MVGHRQPADLRHLRESSRLGAPEEFTNGWLVNLNILDLEARLGCHTVDVVFTSSVAEGSVEVSR